MSSFMKKTGGLSFKPKGGRRAGATSASQAPASASTTRAPTAEPSAQSQASTPAPAVPVEPPPTQAQDPKEPQVDPPKDTAKEATKDTPRAVITEATNPPEPSPPAALSTVQATPERIAPSNSSQPNPPERDLASNDLPTSSNAQGTDAPPINKATTASVSTPAASPAPTPAISLPSTSGTVPTSAAEDTNSRRSLPRATPAWTAPSPVTTPARNETTTSSASIDLRSSAASANRPPLGTSLLSPSPVPVPDPINAGPPADKDQTDGAAQAGPSSAAPKPKRRYVRKRKASQEGEGATNGEAEGGSAAAPKAKRQRKENAPAPEAQEGGTAPDGEAAASAPKRGFRRRASTPKNAEDQTIDHSTTKVGELTRDLGIGKKFKHADLIVERQRQARYEQKMRKLEKQKRAVGLLPAEENNEDGSRSGTPAESAAGTPAPTAPVLNKTQGVAFDIIDGKIVVNQNSLVIDQGAEERTVEMETVEEDEFTHLTTSATYMRASRQMGTNHWTDEETERFYHYLKMFGTDFETISHVFPGKNRRMVKLKFNREEKLRPNRVNAAIMAKGQKKVAIDLDDYKANRLGGDSWISKDKFQIETEERKREMERQLEEKRQERRELGLLDDDPGTAREGDEGAEEREGEVEVIEEDAAQAPTASIEA